MTAPSNVADDMAKKERKKKKKVRRNKSVHVDIDDAEDDDAVPSKPVEARVDSPAMSGVTFGSVKHGWAPQRSCAYADFSRELR